MANLSITSETAGNGKVSITFFRGDSKGEVENHHSLYCAGAAKIRRTVCWSAALLASGWQDIEHALNNQWPLALGLLTIAIFSAWQAKRNFDRLRAITLLEQSTAHWD